MKESHDTDNKFHLCKHWTRLKQEKWCRCLLLPSSTNAESEVCALKHEIKTFALEDAVFNFIVFMLVTSIGMRGKSWSTCCGQTLCEPC
jgi:hypothetical protein